MSPGCSAPASLSSCWYRSGAEMDDDGEDSPEACPWWRRMPEVIRTRERKRTRSGGGTGFDVDAEAGAEAPDDGS